MLIKRGKNDCVLLVKGLGIKYHFLKEKCEMSHEFDMINIIGDPLMPWSCQDWKSRIVLPIEATVGHCYTPTYC